MGASLGGSVVKNLPAKAGNGFDPWVGKIPWRRVWQPTPVFLPGESHGQSSLAGYSPWGRKELDTTEHTHTLMMRTGQLMLPIFLMWIFLKE